MTANTFDSFSIICIETSVENIYNFLKRDEDSQKFEICYQKITIDSFYRSNIMYKTNSYDAIFFESSVKNRTVVIGNKGAWATLCNYISASLNVDNVQFHMNKTLERNTLFYNKGGTISRIVQAIRKENNSWEFVSKGLPLPFENVLNYKKKAIKNRLNKEILIDYCIQNGLNVLDDTFFSSNKNSLYVRYLSSS